MAGFPEPEVGLVISYSYLWKEEEEQGLGRVARTDLAPLFSLSKYPLPNLTAASRSSSRRSRTHHPTTRMSRSKFRLVSKSVWGSTDLRPIRRGETRIDYGLLPPKLFDRLIEKFKELRSQGKVEGASRDEPVSAAKG